MSALNRSRSGGGKKKGSSRRKRIGGGVFPLQGGNQLAGSPYGQAGGTPNPIEGYTGSGPSNTFGGSDPVSALKSMMGKSMGAEGLGPIAAPIKGGGYTRRLRKRSGRARHHRTKSYSAGGKKGRKTRRRHRRRHH